MATVPPLDNEFMEYWLKLSLIQKESLLNVAKNFVGIMEETDISGLRKKIILEERNQYLRGEGSSFSPDEIRQMAVHKDKRNGRL
jgi:hypothetical protein